jgi:hypothetical protein
MTEKRLILDAQFHGNSFRMFYDDNIAKLKELRTNQVAQSEKRRALGLPPDKKLLVNISFPNRFKERFWDFMFRILPANADAHLVLIDYVMAFK